MWWWILTAGLVLVAFLLGGLCGAALMSAIDDRMLANMGIDMVPELPMLKGTPPCNPEYESEL